MKADLIQSYFTPYGYSITCFNLAWNHNWAMVVGPGVGTALQDLSFSDSRNPANWGTPAGTRGTPLDTIDFAILKYGTLSSSGNC